jgi:HAD superfamily hydrolase (TIGR01459 family)
VSRIPEITADMVIDRYTVLLLDAFGVLVDGAGALPGAVSFIEGLNRTGKPYYVLTNDASRLPAARAARFAAVGLTVGVERIITSGGLLRGHFATERLAGARCVVLGTDDSNRYVEEAGGRVVSAAEEFDVLVIANQREYPFVETVNVTLSALFRLLDRDHQVHLVLPNPDLVFPDGDGAIAITAGSVAAIFEAALAARYPHRSDVRFARLGKPHPEMFAEALHRSGTCDMVMLGDQFGTDIVGARGFGLDAVWVGADSDAALATTPPDVWPTYRLRSL